MNYVKKRAYYILGAVGILLILVLLTHLKQYFTLDQLQQHRSWFALQVSNHYALCVFAFIAVYAALIVCTLPVVGPFTLLGSYVFGFWQGVIYSLISCVLGGTISFLAMRGLFTHWVEGFHSVRLEAFRKKIVTHGPLYLLMLHFLSVLPFFVINVVAVLAKVSLRTYILTATIGSLPLVLVYSYAARQLSHIQSLRDIFSPGILAILAVLIILACAPILLRRLKIIQL